MPAKPDRAVPPSEVPLPAHGVTAAELASRDGKVSDLADALWVGHHLD